MVKQARQCAACMMWGLFPFSRDGMCAGCAGWAGRNAVGICSRCWAVRNVDGDGLCRACVFAVRVEVAAGWEAVFPAATQLLLDVKGLGRQGYERLPRRSRGDARPALAPVAEAEERDDPRICPPAVRGQLVLFPVRRRLGRAQARRIDGRHWPEEPELARHAAVMAGAGGVGRSWAYMVMRQVRCALALRDTEGAELVAEELLDQIRLPLTQAARQILDCAGLLVARVAPPPPGRPVGACGHCGSWGITSSLCRNCSCWKHDVSRYPEGTCGRCRRTVLPVHALDGLCRGCLGYVRELGLDHDEGAFTQLTFAGPLAHQLSRKTGALGFVSDQASGPLARAKHRARTKVSERSRDVSAHLVDPAQQVLFPAERDWRALGARPADELPQLTSQARVLVEAFTATFPKPVGHRYVPRGAVAVLRTVLAWLGAGAPVAESDVRALAGVLTSRSSSTLRVLAFLAEHDLLDTSADDETVPEHPTSPPRTGGTSVPLLAEESRRRHHMRMLQKRIALLPEPMAGQLRAWVTVMRGEGRYRHPPADYIRIRRYLYLLWPVLTHWAAAGLDLRQITTGHIRAELTVRKGNQARGLHNVLRSVFGALKQERIASANPLTGLSLTTPVRLPVPLPSDRLRGAFERLDAPAARLIVALVAIHGLRAIDVARLQLDDADLAHHTLAVRRRDGVHTVYLDRLTATLITHWLTERCDRWPTSPNQHLIISSWSAQHPASPPLSYTALRAPFERIGLKPREVWADRVLDEARQTADPVQLVRLFGLHPNTAVKYVHAAHPDKALPRIR
ncbi:hypothetical protein OG824_27355 [Streptomyces prunicolor]|uniref:hypothetical protein n=1 Tax=Streptomyces prunicolor TaxID=67348 RepID=UPI002257BE91|nr:hypothetical protein [Streptomyces prunicolor]MCX5238925.1 hypothetical protein [Streptomyces prunicolor]